MNRANPPLPPGGARGVALPEPGSEAFLRVAGRQFIVLFAAALRSVRMYPIENAVVQNTLTDLASLVKQLAEAEGEVEIRAAGEFLFVNGARLRLDLDNYANFSALLATFRGGGIGSLRVIGDATLGDWTVLLSTLVRTLDGTSGERYDQVVDRLQQANVSAFELAEPAGSADGSGEQDAKEAAKRTYAQGVNVTKDLMNSVRMGQSPNVRKIKRVVQGIVDQILNDETSLIGLTTIRDYDDYTFTHSLNVCIFAVALGRRLGFTRLQLYDLGMAGLFHDLGKARVPLDTLRKPDMLSDEEWRLISAHPWLGVLALFQLREQQEHPYRSMIVAYEHHMKRDLSGYPRSVRTTEIGMYSKIVAVADGFDAATSRRVYQAEPMNPAAVLQEMRDNPRRGMDPVIVKAFVALLGIYPVGTLVILDTFELAVTHAVNPVAELVSRPIIRIISDDRGNLTHPGELFDLATQGPDGSFVRTIIKTADPDHYGIRVGDYFV